MCGYNYYKNEMINLAYAGIIITKMKWYTEHMQGLKQFEHLYCFPLNLLKRYLQNDRVEQYIALLICILLEVVKASE